MCQTDRMSMIRCSNQNMRTKMGRLRDILMDTTESMRARISVSPDAAVLAEMTTMGSLSMKCRHYPTSRSHAPVFERPIESDIPSFLGDIQICASMIMDPGKELNVRSNPVTAAIISDCISMIEFMDSFKSSEQDVGTIVLVSYPSVTHAAVVAQIFECISAYCGWDGVVNMIMITDETTKIAMEAYVGPRMNVGLTCTEDKTLYVKRLYDGHWSGYMMIIAHDEGCSRMLLTRERKKLVDISMIVSLDTIDKESWFRKMSVEKRMLMEMIPCSEPEWMVVRLVSAREFGEIHEMVGRMVRKDEPIYGFMRWYNVMIRRCRLGRVCYDCMIAFELAHSLLYAMSGREMDTTEFTEAHWMENFNTTININSLLH